MLPRPGQRGQHGNGPDRRAAVFRALHAVVHAQRGGPGRRVFAGQTLDLARGYAGPGGHALRCVFARPLGQLLKAVGHLVDIGAVFQALIQDDVHQAQRQRGIRAGADGDMPVGQRGSARAVGVDDDQPCPAAPRLFHKGPEVDVVAVNVRAPGQDQLGQAEVLGGCAQLLAVDQVPGHAACLGTDGPIQLACAQAMKEAPVHGAEAQHADGARVAVGQDRLGAVAVGSYLKFCGNRIQRLVPAGALKGFVLAASL